MSKATAPDSRLIEVHSLARVEGEGSLQLRLEQGRVVQAHFSLYEPPRFFEAFLRGRSYGEAPDITARICGICPVAYQMSSSHALENAFGVSVNGPIRALRRLFYCGEWIESHALHMFLLHLPDFLGYESALPMAADHRDLVVRALRLKKAGNEVVRILGGREVHPINARVGGFHRVPEASELEELVKPLQESRAFLADAIRFLAKLDFPDFEVDYDSVALRHPTEVALNEGHLATSRQLEVPISQFASQFEEVHVKHSTALQGHLRRGGPYLVGPLARLNLNWDLYPAAIKDLATQIGFTIPCRNQFKSILARGFETLYALDHAVEIIQGYARPARPAVEITPRAGVGHGCTEAPRGILYHCYEVGDDGLIKKATIVPPTAQNQAQIEADLAAYAPRLIDLPDEELARRCEHLIRNYDPCISCATHFLRVRVDGRKTASDSVSVTAP